MSTGTMTTKGQITIPVEVRDALNIRTGTRVQFLPKSDGTWDFIPLTGSVMDLAGFIKWDGPPVTLEEMELRYIRQVYAQCGGNKVRTAERLGITRQTLSRRLDEGEE